MRGIAEKGDWVPWLAVCEILGESVLTQGAVGRDEDADGDT